MSLLSPFSRFLLVGGSARRCLLWIQGCAAEIVSHATSPRSAVVADILLTSELHGRRFPRLSKQKAEVSPSRRRIRYPTKLMLCENEEVSTVQNNGRTTGGVT